MRTKRNQKIPQCFEDFVHGIKSTNTKNKANVSIRKTDKDGKQRVDVCQNGEKGHVKEVKDRVNVLGGNQDCLDQGLTYNGKRNEDFVDDPNGDQFPPMSIQDNVEDLGEIQECLNQDIRNNGNRDIEYEKSEGINNGSKIDDVNNRAKENVQEVADSEKKKGHNDMSKQNSVWDKKFNDVVSANRIDNKLEEIATVIGEDVKEVVVLSDEVIELGCEKWSNIVCGYFVGCKVDFNEARYHLRRMWNKYGFMDILNNENEVYLFKFHDEGGMNEVVSNEPWLVINKPLFVQKWRVGMVLDMAEPRKLPLWVKLYNIPLEAWNVKGITAIASSLGKPIIKDEITTRMCAKGEGRIGFASNRKTYANKKFMDNKENTGKSGGNVYYKQNWNVNNRGRINSSIWNGRRQMYGFSRAQNNVRHEYVKRKENLDKGKKVMVNEDTRKDNGIKEQEKRECSGSGILGSSSFTLMEGMVNEDDLIPTVEQRKVVDEMIRVKGSMGEKEINEWNLDMKRYYRDKSELLRAAMELEKEENVISPCHDDESNVLRDEVKGMGSDILEKDV
ncbi:zinc knuckle CX2CX4HX4C containing protein [Tanacetum coccineum]